MVHHLGVHTTPMIGGKHEDVMAVAPQLDARDLREGGQPTAMRLPGSSERAGGEVALSKHRRASLSATRRGRDRKGEVRVVPNAA